MKRKFSHYFYGFLALTGGIFFTVMGVLYYIESSGGNVDHAVETTGKIIKLVKQDTQSNIIPTLDFTVYNPWVQFTASDGKSYQFLDLYASDDETKYSIGQTVNISYNELNPNQAMILRNAPLWGEHLILIALGIVCFFMVWVIFKIGI